MSNVVSKENPFDSIDSLLHLARVDVHEVTQLHADALKVVALTARYESLHIAAHQLFVRQDKKLPLNTAVHTKTIAELEALHKRLTESLDYFITLYVCDCGETDRQDPYFVPVNDHLNSKGQS